MVCYETDASLASSITCREKMEQEVPFIMQVLEGEESISVTAEEYEILREYFQQAIKKGDMERERLYFRGHTDGFADLKFIGEIKREGE